MLSVVGITRTRMCRSVGINETYGIVRADDDHQIFKYVRVREDNQSQMMNYMMNYIYIIITSVLTNSER